ncbi:GNAT family N-acetyltransferase [Dehalogenimonas etheniformans]|uniref:N-acetyltransferase n=1 Tax=Dehalogenimonas etheniformans TaxID=1536648 RepID=A0A2P5P6N1_9CHLR|nr:GNAT family protein [Dehalogenimonas etheniformans]PPD57947.1 N-acetyltransferase [Dehalogenimonas etheniformans]QNT75298.1 GNAT family N-acetyltransferase [Dehalogenimonas etheniformans]
MSIPLESVHNLGFEDVEICGQSVKLRPLSEADAEPAWELIHDNREILKWLLWDGPSDKAELARTWQERWPEEMRRGLSYHFAIEPLETPGFVGAITIKLPYHPDSVELGYWLGLPYWNRGYMTEAIGLACCFAFTCLDAVRVSSTVFADNFASRRALEKNGFNTDGRLRRDVLKFGQWQDTFFMTLLAEEWLESHVEPCSVRLVPHVEPPGILK